MQQRRCKGQSSAVMRLYDHAKRIWQWGSHINIRWKLHNNVSRNGYGNAMIGSYGGCFEEDIMWLMCERAYRLTMHRGSLHHISRWDWEMHGIEEASKYKDIGGSVRNRILALVRRTHPLIISNSLSSQESHEQPCIPRRVYGGLVILAHLDPYYVRGYLRNQHKHGST